MTLRCPVCVTRRATFASMLKHKQSAGHHKPCGCGGYHYPHRPGSPRCETNPYVRYHCARTEGATYDEQLEAFIEDALFNKHKPTTECPF